MKLSYENSAVLGYYGANTSPTFIKPAVPSLPSVPVGASFDPAAVTSINDWSDFTLTPTSNSGLGYATLGDPVDGSTEYQGQLSFSNTKSYSDIFFCGGRVGSTWTQCGTSNTYWAKIYNDVDHATALSNGNDKNTNANPDFMSFVLDWSASEHPNYATATPSSNAAQDPYRFAFSTNWLGYGKGVSPDPGEVFQNNSTTGDPEYIIPDGEKRTALENLMAAHIAGTNGADIRDVVIRAAAPDATSYFQVRCKSWTDNGNGTATLTFYQGSGINGSGSSPAAYFRFCLYNTEVRPDPANVSLTEAGTYCIDIFNNKVYYRPASGNAPVSFKVSIPFRSNFLRASGNGATLSVESCTICGFSSCNIGGTNQGFVNVSGSFVEGTASYDGVYSYRNGVGHGLNFSPGDPGTNNDGVTLYRSIFDADISGIGVSPGANIQRCMFIEPQSKSCVRTNGMQPSGGGASTFTILPKTIFKYNFGQVAFSIHGQVLSLYNSAWRNSEVFGNIFYNCEGAYSAQEKPLQFPNPDGNLSEPVPGSLVNEYTWSNNLVYHDIDRAFEYDQAGIAIWNDAPVFTDSYTAEVRNNTLINAKYDEDPGGYTADYTFMNPVKLSLRNANTAGNISAGSSLYVSGNIAAILEYSLPEDAAVVASQYDNFVGSDSGSASTWGLYDAGVIFSTLVSDGSVMDSGTTTLSSSSAAKRILGINSSETTVGTRSVGIKWSQNPTRQNLKDIMSTKNLDWSDTYAPQALSARVENPDESNTNSLSSAVVLGGDYRNGWPLEIGVTDALWFGELNVDLSNNLTASAGYGIYDRNGSGVSTSPYPETPDVSWIDASNASSRFFFSSGAHNVWRFDVDYGTGAAPPTISSNAWNAATPTNRRLKIISPYNVEYTYILSDSIFDASVLQTDRWSFGTTDTTVNNAVMQQIYADHSGYTTGQTIKVALYLVP